MKYNDSRSRQRHGMVAPLAAVLSVPLLGMLAFTIDIGYIVLTQQELQNGADAGSLAAIKELQDEFLPYYQAPASNPIDSAKTRATSKAQSIVQTNFAGAKQLVFSSGSDIEFGFTSSAGVYTSPTAIYPNTVKVTTRRDSSTSPLSLFFGRIFNFGTINLTATAGATLYYTSASSIVPNTTVIPGLTGSDLAGILPLAYNVNWYNEFLRTGMNPDGVTPASTDANGTPYLTAFGGGGSSNSLGQANWGWISLDATHNGSSELMSWVDNGVPQSDYDSLTSAGLMPVSSHNSTTNPTSNEGPSGSWDWLGDNGSKVTVAHVINSYIGKTFLIPLYKPIPIASGLPTGVSAGDAGVGNSNKYYYNIVAFVPIKIISADNNTVSIAPSTSLPPQAQVITKPTILDTSSTTLFDSTSSNPPVIVPAKLTQ